MHKISKVKINFLHKDVLSNGHDPYDRESSSVQRQYQLQPQDGNIKNGCKHRKSFTLRCWRWERNDLLWYILVWFRLACLLAMTEHHWFYKEQLMLATNCIWASTPFKRMLFSQCLEVLTLGWENVSLNLLYIYNLWELRLLSLDENQNQPVEQINGSLNEWHLSIYPSIYHEVSKLAEKND